MVQEFNHIEKICGELNLPGDKSISHRSIFFSSMAEGESVIYNLLDSDDIHSTINAFRQLGAEIKFEKDFVRIKGKGYKGFKKHQHEIDAGNSGTTARLISGLLAAQDFPSVIIGDSSLSKRPMKRVIDPLREMGGIIESDTLTLPLRIFPSNNLKVIEYTLPVASAQVKSAILLCGLHLLQDTIVIENIPTRNHTELMLGLPIVVENNQKKIFSSKKYYPVAKEYFIPSDISSTSFFIVLALLVKNSNLIIRNVSLNESRTGIIQVLKKMGGNIETDNVHNKGGEVIGDIIVKSSKLKNIEIENSIIPNIIDEIAVLAVAGLFAEGRFTINNASELRTKESDRINAVCSNLRLAGVEVEEFNDGFSFDGGILHNNFTFESYDDHRIAMAFSVLSLLLNNGGKINNFGCVKISNPQFLSQLKDITG